MSLVCILEKGLHDQRRNSYTLSLGLQKRLILSLGLQERLIPLEVPGRCLAFTDLCFPPGHGLFLAIFSAGLQIWSWTGAGEKEKSHRRRRVMGDLAGLTGQRVLLLVGLEQWCCCQTLENKGEVLCSLAWCLCSARAGPVQLLLPAPLPCRISSSLSHPLCLPLLDGGGGGEMSKRRSLGCTEGVLVVCILS